LGFDRGNCLYVNTQVMEFVGKRVKVMNRVEINVPLRRSVVLWEYRKLCGFR